MALKRAVVLALLLSLAAPLAHAGTWTGAGIDSNWSNVANWDMGNVPNSATSLASFQGVGLPLAVNADIPITLQQMLLQSANWALTGQTITFSAAGGDITVSSASAPTIANNLVFQGMATFTIETSLALGSVSGAAGLIKYNPGSLSIASFGIPGAVTVVHGTLTASPILGTNSLVMAPGTTVNTTASQWGSIEGTGGTLSISVQATVGINGLDKTFQGTLTGGGTLSKVGSGSLTIRDSSLGSMMVAGGKLALDSGIVQGPITIANGGTLGGQGPVNNMVTVQGGGTLAPASPGVISMTGLFIEGTLAIRIDGAPNTGQAQLVVNGGVTLNSASLSLSGSYVPVVGDTFALVFNDSVDAISGTFSGLPEGSFVTFNGVPLRISYVDNDGNDLTLRAVASADVAIAQSATPNPANDGKDVVITLMATNNGPAAATGIAISNPIPAGAAHVWASPGCSLAAGTVTCTSGSLAMSASKSFKLVLRPTASGSITNVATVNAPEFDATSANNSSSLPVTVNATPAGVPVQRYRLYSDVTKEHHFTTDLNEYNVLGSYVGTWVQEGPVGKVLNNPGLFAGVVAVPYYRLYDTNTRWHHWTTDANEYYTLAFVYSGWNMEGVDGYILLSNPPGTTQLYRLNYPPLGALHHWTIDANEYNTLITSFGWVGEPGAGFVVQ